MDAGWYEEFFQGLALELWRRAIPEEQTRAEADFLAGVFGNPEGRAILDVPCGNGRLTLPLAGRGYRMTGVDLCGPFLAEARERAGAAGLEIAWRQGDMRELPWEEAFHGACCMGNSFGYFDAAGSAVFLDALARSLKPAGRLVLHTVLAAESLLPGLEDRAWRRVGEMLLLVENRYHAPESRLETDYTFVLDGKTETRRACHWIFTAGEIQRMLARSGLETVSMFDSLEKEPYRYGSDALILVAEKR